MWVSLEGSPYSGVILKDFGPEESSAQRSNRREGTHVPHAGLFATQDDAPQKLHFKFTRYQWLSLFLPQLEALL